MTSPYDPFADPKVRAEMERMGIVHAPGTAAEVLAQLKPLLAADGIDLDDPSGIDLDDLGTDGLQAALDRAVEQHNLTLFTPVGTQREAALRRLARFTRALAADDTTAAEAALSEIGPDAHDGLPAAADVIGTGLGLLDTWLGAGDAGTVRVPKWTKPARAAATDILALARKGRAFDALHSLTIRHGGQAIFGGVMLLVATVLAGRAARHHASIDEVIVDALGPDAAAPEPAAAAPETDESGMPQHPSSSSPTEAADRPQPPTLSRAERAVIRTFGDWLDVQPETDIPSTGEGVRMLRTVFALIRQAGHDPLDVDGVVAFIDEIADWDLPEEVYIALGEYTLFQMDAAETEEWDDLFATIQELRFENAGMGGIVAAAMDAGAAVDADVRFDALVRLRLVSAVSDLLDWIGRSRPIAPSGGVQLTDIAHLGELLGVPVAGSASPHSSDAASEPALPIDEPAADVRRVTSMLEVPALVAWWSALGNAGLIEIKRSRVVPGDAAAEWRSADVPPPQLAEMVAALFLARLLLYPVENRPSATDLEAVDAAIQLVVAGIDVTGTYEPDAPSASRSDARAILQPARELGLLDFVNGRVVVADALRLTIAHGVTTAMMMLNGPEDDEYDDVDVE